MHLKMAVSKQVKFMGKTPGGCKLVLHNLLDNGQDVFQFMQLFDEAAIAEFYDTHQEEIDKLCIEDQENYEEASEYESVKLALEKTLMLIEGEIKNGNRS